MFACGGLGLYFHGQEGLAAIFSLFAAILEKFKFLVLGPLVGPLCNGVVAATATHKIPIDGGQSVQTAPKKVGWRQS